MSDRDIHYSVELVHPFVPPPGMIQLATAAVLSCGLCGEMIAGSGGPGPAICWRCGDQFMRGNLRGCVRWDGPDDTSLTPAPSQPEAALQPVDEGVRGVQPVVKKLEWTPEAKPNDYCSYNHTFADSPIGRYQIEWKGWKDHPSFSLDLGNDSVACWASDVDGARRIAQADYEARVLSAIDLPTPPLEGE